MRKPKWEWKTAYSKRCSSLNEIELKERTELTKSYITYKETVKSDQG